LTRPAEAITLLEVAELVDGPVEAGVPKLVKGADRRIDRELQAACEQAAEVVRWNLGPVSLAELADVAPSGPRRGAPGTPRRPESFRPRAAMLPARGL
jgi:DNA-binding IscR family transcriptional regulator